MDVPPGDGTASDRPDRCMIFRICGSFVTLMGIALLIGIQGSGPDVLVPGSIALFVALTGIEAMRARVVAIVPMFLVAGYFAYGFVKLFGDDPSELLAWYGWLASGILGLIFASGCRQAAAAKKHLRWL